MLKPNKYEAEILTGVEIKDFQSAKIAAKKLIGANAVNILITAGKDGAYFFNEKTAEHLPVPEVRGIGVFDETGCGDQVTASLAVSICRGEDILEAARLAVLAGTIQFYKQGILPVTEEELRREKI